jgi:hypothetical protein
LAVFWNDGFDDVDYKGISKSDAIAWVREFCSD